MDVKGSLASCLTLPICLLFLCSCESRRAHETHFTKTDSITGTYLSLQDTMVLAWNMMISDDNRKIRAIRALIHELEVTQPEIREQLGGFREQVEDLAELRYDQKSISEETIVRQYDFAANALITELLALAEAQREFRYNTTLQRLVDSIRAAHERVHRYRYEYDEIARRYNRFVENNRHLLTEINHDSFLEKKPLFGMEHEQDPLPAP